MNKNEKSNNKLKSTSDKPINKKSEEKLNPKDNNNSEERNGILPENMDFKKFLGCGG